jgi:hypothetical protein
MLYNRDQAVKIDRHAQIGGQPAKLVRDFLADASNSNGFYLDLADEYLLKGWWRTTVNGLIDAGKIDPRNRRLCMHVRSRSPQHSKLFGVPLPKMPDFSPRSRTLSRRCLRAS